MVKRPRREADHSPPSRAEFKNTWSYTSTPPYIFMIWCLVKQKDAFNLIMEIRTIYDTSFFPLSLAPQLSLGLGLLLKIRLNFLEASQHFSFLQGRVVIPTPNPHPGGPGLCTYILQREGGCPF
jgi:hypothetical protein